MDTPLGRAVGNANEVIESFETLKGKGPKDIEELSLLFAARMLMLAGLETTESAAVSRVRAALTSGKGVEAFAAIIEQQGGDPKVIDDYGRMPKASAKDQLTAPADGTVTAMHAELVGRAAVALGAGRDRAEAGVDSAAGIDILAPVGATVRRGDPIFALACSDAARTACGESVARRGPADWRARRRFVFCFSLSSIASPDAGPPPRTSQHRKDSWSDCSH
jgi:thymidine phosphorylase